jgi:hypothetical protein
LPELSVKGGVLVGSSKGRWSVNVPAELEGITVNAMEMSRAANRQAPIRRFFIFLLQTGWILWALHAHKIHPVNGCFTGVASGAA